MIDTRFVMVVRPVEARDITSRVRFVPDPDDHVMYLEGFSEELRAANHIVQAVERIGSSFQLSTTRPIEASDLSALLAPLFDGQFHDKLRCVSVAQAQQSVTGRRELGAA